MCYLYVFHVYMKLIVICLGILVLIWIIWSLFDEIIIFYRNNQILFQLGRVTNKFFTHSYLMSDSQTLFLFLLETFASRVNRKVSCLQEGSQKNTRSSDKCWLLQTQVTALGCLRTSKAVTWAWWIHGNSNRKKQNMG